MEKDLTPYEIALALKELGFDEPCLMYWNDYGKQTTNNRFQLLNNIDDWSQNYIDCPTFSQAFRFFREKHKLHHSILFNNVENNYDFIYGEKISGGVLGNSNTYEEAELECLKKLIELVKQ